MRRFLYKILELEWNWNGIVMESYHLFVEYAPQFYKLKIQVIDNLFFLGVKESKLNVNYFIIIINDYIVLIFSIQ